MLIKKVIKKFGGEEKSLYLCTRLQEARAFSSVGLEHLPYKQRVGGSNPSTPTLGCFPRGLSGLRGIFLFFYFSSLLFLKDYYMYYVFSHRKSVILQSNF